MLQNRVDPFGRIISTPARGLWLGNRGVIHNDRKQIVMPYKHQAWIICKLEFKGRTRKVMTPGRWTELFFLDEATALAAGHRPCFECRREDANRFKYFWIQGNQDYHFDMKTSIREIDAIIHAERIDKEKRKVMHERTLNEIPDGCFIRMNEDAFLISRGKSHRWTPFGYEDGSNVQDQLSLEILTPSSIVNALKAGYVPQIKL